MKYSFRNISKKNKVITLIQVNIKSLGSSKNLFIDIMFKNVCRSGYACSCKKFHDLLPSTQNLKYLVYDDIAKAESLFKNARKEYLTEIYLTEIKRIKNK